MAAVLAVAALTLTASLVGVAVTSVWPTEVSTSSYAATVRLSAEPDQLSTLHAPTLFGDLDLRFDGVVPAPGINAVAQVSDRITTVLATKDLSVGALKPTPAELDQVTSTVVSHVGGKFALGVLVTCLLVAFAIRHWRSRDAALRPWRRAVVIPALAAVLALGGTAGAAWTTFQPGRLEAVGTNGLLGYVRSNTRILADVEARSEQASPYVKNMLALSAALQDKFVPAELATPASVKVLLVSDIHGANAYPLMRQIIQTEGITAVVDTGDLINFGRVEEAEAGGLFTGIRSLGVPYLFVRGNHDATSPTDEALLQRMAQVPGVVVLQPAPRRYTIATVGGLRVGGFNDPRWFGDDGGGGATSQVPAAEAFTEAMDQLRAGTAVVSTPSSTSGATATPSGGTPAPTTPGTKSPTPTPSQSALAADSRRGLDLLVTHEPYAADRVGDAGIRLNGHMHSAGLQGNRIQVGTFTGGGVVSHYIQDKQGGELSGQPYAFDILSFGADCRLQTLTRYSYRDLLEGRPVYDDVRAINGAAIQAPAPSPGRACRADAPVTLQDVRAASPDEPAATSTP
ncbi:metallophosphoesterase family protein [Arsenicicoccus sp. oral taxon 190]|uniref:metallophosphoesterase family protein n=1 Tax=Arsenicicoccus sp. oral taxon 190 TaxID=1658671 RepID=UPI00067A0D62|nr:metallophosphoesterase family protein [Arsenicicoccus sp. oral taxon 190]AKT51085.1 hypothetical protein ADJ73_06715 [Arsenicicoccus sp. oral taxon 190]